MKKKTATLNAVNKSSDKSQQVGNGYKKAQVAITVKPTGNKPTILQTHICPHRIGQTARSGHTD